MNRRILGGSRANRDRREVSFARSVIAEAERRRRAEATTDARDPMDSGLCCLARHAPDAVPPWTCDCPCHTRTEPDESEEV